MKRTAIWLVALAMLTSCGTDTTPADDASQVAVQPETSYEWKLVMAWPKNTPGLATAAERLVQNIETMTNGRLKINVYGAGEYVPALQVFDTVSSGVAEMGHSAAYYWRGKSAVFSLFGTVPFGMTVQEKNGWLHHGGGLELWREAYAPFNLIPFPAGNSGVQMAGWFNKEINTLEDIQGLKMRIPGLGGDVFERAGGTAVQLPGNEIFTSLQTGVIDATEWVGPFNDLAFGLQDIAQYYYYPGWQEPNAVIELMVNKTAYESLPKDLQKIIEVAARASNQDMLDEYTARNMVSLKAVTEEHNVQLKQLPTEVLQVYRQHAEAVLDELAQEDELSGRIVNSYKEFLASVKEWHSIAEEAYFAARRGEL